MIVCPQCRREVGGRGHPAALSLYRSTSQISCQACGYYGIPLRQGCGRGAETKKAKTGKKRAKKAPHARPKRRKRSGR